RSDRDWSSDVCSSDLRWRVWNPAQFQTRQRAHLENRLISKPVQVLQRLNGHDGIGRIAMRLPIQVRQALVDVDPVRHVDLKHPRSEERRVGEEWRAPM